MLLSTEVPAHFIFSLGSTRVRRKKGLETIIELLLYLFDGQKKEGENRK